VTSTALGVVLHELLTGKLPYSSAEPNVLRQEIVAGAMVGPVSYTPNCAAFASRPWSVIQRLVTRRLLSWPVSCVGILPQSVNQRHGGGS